MKNSMKIGRRSGSRPGEMFEGLCLTAAFADTVSAQTAAASPHPLMKLTADLTLETLDIQFAPHPILRIAMGANDTVVLTWPAAGKGYRLQRTSSLNGATWSNIPNTPVLNNNNEYQVTLPKTSANAYFRLMAP